MKTYEAKLTYSLVAEGPAEKCESAEKVVEYMRGAFDERPEQESFWVIFLNRKNFAKGRFMATLGTQVAALADAPTVYRAALLANATAIICVHNHPSGDPAPSAADTSLTRILREAGKAIGIELLDHVIIGDAMQDPNGKGFYSFREAGLI